MGTDQGTPGASPAADPSPGSSPAAGSAAAPTTTELAGRIDGLEGKIDQVLGKLGQDEQAAHTAAAQHTASKLDRPTAIADEVRSQIDQARQREADQAAQDGTAAELATVKQELASLKENLPGQPQRRIERIWA